MKWLLILSMLFCTFAHAEQVEDRGRLSAAEFRAFLIASQRYPDLQTEDSPHARAYQALLDQAIQTKSVVFKDPNWPLLIAEKSRASLTALQQGRRKVGATDIEKYEDAIAKMRNSKSEKVRQFGELEHAAHQAELSGDLVRAAEIRTQLGQLRALGRIESLLMQMNDDIWRIKIELGIP